MRRFILLLLLPCAILMGNIDTVRVPEVDIHGIPSSMVNGVGVVSGSYSESEVNLYLDGPTPLIWEDRFNSMAIGPTPTFNGWSHNHTRYSPRGIGSTYREYDTVSVLIIRGDGGSQEFRKTNTAQPLTIPSKRIPGTTNLAAEIGGRTNPRNAYLHMDKSGSHGTYFQEDGKIREYGQVGLGTSIKLKREIQADKNVFHYSDSKHESFIRVAASNPQGNEYAWICPSRFSANSRKKIQEVETTCSDGRSVIYEYTKSGNDTHLLTGIKRPTAPDVTYEYETFKGKYGPRMVKKSYPDGRSTATSYYCSGNNDILGTQIKVGRKDKRKSRVKERLAPVGSTSDLIPTQSFVYNFHKEKGAPGKGSTDVYDANRNRTQYIYNKHKLVTEIARYEGSQQLISKQVFSWLEGDDSGQIESIELQNANGQILSKQTFDYDGRGNIIQCEFSQQINGRALDEYATHTISYTHENDLVTCETHPNGRVVRFTYYPETNLVTSKLTYDNGSLVQREFYRYVDGGILLESIVDNGTSPDPEDLSDVSVRTIEKIQPRMQMPAYGKADEKRRFYWEDGKQHLLGFSQYSYDEYGNMIEERVYGSDGQYAFCRNWQYDERSRVTSQTDAEGSTSFHYYDANDNLIRVEGPRPGEVRTYEYDFSNRLIAEHVEYHGECWTKRHEYDYLHNRIATIDPQGNVTRMSYDSLGNVTHVVHPDGTAVLLQYDPLGNVISTVDEDDFESQSSFNAKGKPLVVRNADGTEEQFEYCVEGHLMAHYHSDGSVTRYIRDALGRELAASRISAEGVELSSTKRLYRGTQLVESIDAEGYLTKFDYDGAGRLVATHYPAQTIRYLYDSLGRKTHTVYEDRVEVELRDYLDRVTEKRLEDRNGTVYSQYNTVYDEAGNVLYQYHTTDQGIAVTKFSYDGCGRPIEKVDATGHSTRWMYDDNYVNVQGQVVKRTTEIDPIGRMLICEFDVRGRVKDTLKLDPYGSTVAHSHVTHDGRGNVVIEEHDVLLEGQKQHTYYITRQYGPKNQVQLIRENDERTTIHLFDNKGRIAETQLPDGNKLYFQYDGISRLCERSSSDGSIHYRYHYDARDLPVLIEDLVNHTMTRRAYDSMGRLIDETLANGHSISQSYGGNGRVTQVTIDHEQVQYGYDPIGPNEVTWRERTQRVIQRNSSGLVAEVAGIEGTVTFDHDILGRLQRVQSDFYQFDAKDGYDEVGRLVHYRESSGTDSIGYRFNYDDLNQLTQEQGYHCNTYLYDSLGNRREKNNLEHRIDSFNQLTDDGSTTYRYDDAGRRITKEDGAEKYTYDALGRLIKFNSGDCEVHYQYDAFNRRICKRVNRGNSVLIQDYLYWNRSEVGMVSDGELEEFRVLTSSEGSEIGKAMAILWDRKVWMPVQDFRGSMVGLVRNGQLHYTHRYSAFGESDKPSPLPWGFSGKRFDPESGLLFFGVRYFDPSTGRWATPDPAGFIDGPNLYAYVKNSPLTHSDDWGQFTKSIRQAIHVVRRFANYVTRPGPLTQSIHDSPEEFERKLAHNRRWSHPYIYCVGDKDPEGGRILFVHGICTTHEEFHNMLTQISNEAGGVRVYGVGYETLGMGNDLLHCVARKAGSYKYASKVTKRLIRELDKDMDGKGIVGALFHSGGAIVGCQAIKRLPQSIRDNIIGRTYGGAQRLVQGETRNSANYIAVSQTNPLAGDLVTYFGAIGRGGHGHAYRQWQSSEDPVYRGNDFDLPALGEGWQHEFLEPTYSTQWKKDVRNLLYAFEQNRINYSSI